MSKKKAMSKQSESTMSDFNRDNALLKSPRTLEACRRQGYSPTELIFKSKQDIKIEIGDLYITDDILELRWKNYEDRRKEKIKNVMAERKKVIEEFTKKGKTTNDLVSKLPMSPWSANGKHKKSTKEIAKTIIEENKELLRERKEIEQIKTQHKEQIEAYIEKELAKEFKERKNFENDIEFKKKLK